MCLAKRQGLSQRICGKKERLMMYWYLDKFHSLFFFFCHLLRGILFNFVYSFSIIRHAQRRAHRAQLRAAHQKQVLGYFISVDQAYSMSLVNCLDCQLLFWTRTIEKCNDAGIVKLGVEQQQGLCLRRRGRCVIGGKFTTSISSMSVLDIIRMAHPLESTPFPSIRAMQPNIYN